MAKILIVDDNDETRAAIKDLLLQERHNADEVSTAIEAWDFIETYDYDLLIFDWEMPKMSGVELLQKYRASGGKTPVIMLTGRNSTPDKISGLDFGADNYVTKPFESEVLLSLIRATLRRSPEPELKTIKCGDLDLNPESSQVSCGSNTATLSSKEAVVLRLLLENSQRLISHEEIKACGWSDAPDTASGTIRVFLTGLREKLTKLGSKLQILNVRGYGYQIKF
ncbi:MAG: response regulator transcription factor [Candidatus Obscuribacterales bacterium]|nr:response regulator transcription factor [Candidatus Obscuribacterales bacterium]